LEKFETFQLPVKKAGGRSSGASPNEAITKGSRDVKYNSVRLSPAASSKYILKNQKKIKSKQELHIPYRK